MTVKDKIALLIKNAFGQRVRCVKTPVSEDQMANAIIEAWTDMFGSTPAKEQVAMILAQNALETGHGQRMWNYNIGNITTDGKGPYDFYDDIPTNEQVQPGVWEEKYLKYRAYPSLVDGVKDYLTLLSGKHYTEAWQHIIHPDPVEFSKALKKAGYYTADEAPYTKTLTSLFNQFSSSNGPTKSESPMTPQINESIPSNDTVEDTLDQYIKMLAASQKFDRKLLKKALPNNDVLIQLTAPDYTSAIEFSRVLCTALDEELLSKSYAHTDSKSVEVECSIPGPPVECFATVKQLSDAVAETFYDATIKIGGIVIKTNCIMNKKSSYQPISLRTADTNYRKFLLKFV